MSGATIPYALRQNKFVDRRIFIDLLSRIERFQPLDDHVYISMGGATLEDHRLAHALIGMDRLVSFDSEAWVVARQHFNKPVDYIRVLKLTSGDLIANFSAEMGRLGFGGTPNVAIWLDYTAPSKLGEQVRELNQLLSILQRCDVVRITVNSSASAIYRPETVDGRRETAAEFRPKRLERLKARLDEYMPEGVGPDDMTDEGVARVIALAVAKAAKAAYPAHSNQVAFPLSLVRYADGQQMLSCTLIVLNREELDCFQKRTKAPKWPFFSKNWTDIHTLSIPDLTLRERMFINERIPGTSSEELCKELGFPIGGDEVEARDHLAQYLKYYRFYPHFHHVNL